MEIEDGKLFVGGISWDTNEDRLRDYFWNFGDVVEAIILRDRATGRARGFGFVVFADLAVAERVVQEKHMIDGRNVEVKKAVPRDDRNNILRNARSNNVSPTSRTKKIFVGGLPSSITEGDFRRYFAQFGFITDIVVMHDQNTQRPRGFGFITYDTEDAVNRALYKIFHELKGKMVEVKRAVPKELFPGPHQSPLRSHSPGMSRVSSFTNGYIQGGYASSPFGNYGGGRAERRVSPGTGVTADFVSLYGKGLHGETNMNSSYGLNANFDQNFNYVRGSSPLYGGISGRPALNGPTGNFDGGSPLPSLARGSLWGDDSIKLASNSGNFTGLVRENSSIDPYESIRKLWGCSSSLGDHGEVNGSKFGGGNSYFGNIDDRHSGSYWRNNVGVGVVGPPSPYPTSGGGSIGSLDIYENGLAYVDPTWRSSSSSLENEDCSSSSFGPGNTNADIMTRGSAGYIGHGMAMVK